MYFALVKKDQECILKTDTRTKRVVNIITAPHIGAKEDKL